MEREASTSFPRSVKMKKNETVVVFAYIVYKSCADRDRCIAKVMKDKRFAAMTSRGIKQVVQQVRSGRP